MISIPWYFMDKLNKPSEFGQYYLIIGFITLFWGLYAGTIVDRFNRKRVFLGLTGAGALVIGSITAIGYYLNGLPELLVVCVFATTFFIYNLHYPSLYAFMQEITERRLYGKITSYLEVQGQFTSMLAGACAVILLEGTPGGTFELFGVSLNIGFTLEPWPLRKIFLLDTITYVLSFLIVSTIVFVPLVQRNIDSSGLVQRIKNGVEYLKKNPLVFIFGNASYFVFVTTLIIGFYLMAVYVSDVLKAEGNVYATGEMLFAFGSLMAGVASAQLFKRFEAVDTIAGLATITTSVFVALFISTDVNVFYLGAFLLGFSNASIRIQRVTFLFRIVPNDVIGRASSVFFIFNTLFRLIFIGMIFKFFTEPDKVPYAMLMLAIFVSIGVLILLSFKSPLIALGREEDAKAASENNNAG